ncbi:hypothetical protein CFP56_033740 [Quercus suber]|uniref:Uncharacterized protein n=1 Tax=Quercus suber TaxID=58331 RepID=A0AAW0LT55_QUESU
MFLSKFPISPTKNKFKSIEWYEGDGMKKGTSCSYSISQFKTFIIILSTSVGILILLLGGSIIYWVLTSKRKSSSKRNSSNKMQLTNYRRYVKTINFFYSKKLQKATNNYDDNMSLAKKALKKFINECYSIIK